MGDDGCATGLYGCTYGGPVTLSTLLSKVLDCGNLVFLKEEGVVEVKSQAKIRQALRMANGKRDSRPVI